MSNLISDRLRFCICLASGKLPHTATFHHDHHVVCTHYLQMLWNWFVIDSCFLARSWHVRSNGAFAASCIGVVFLVISLEMVRRVQREYDGYLRLLIANRTVACTSCDNGAAKTMTSSSGSSDGHDHKIGHGTNVTSTPVAGNEYVSKLAYFKSRNFLGPAATRVKVYQHAIRSFFYMVQFAVAYIVMLLAMYFNGEQNELYFNSGANTSLIGYIIISIYIGAFLGAFIFQWDNLHSEQREPCCG